MNRLSHRLARVIGLGMMTFGACALAQGDVTPIQTTLNGDPGGGLAANEINDAAATTTWADANANADDSLPGDTASSARAFIKARWLGHDATPALAVEPTPTLGLCDVRYGPSATPKSELYLTRSLPSPALATPTTLQPSASVIVPAVRVEISPSF